MLHFEHLIRKNIALIQNPTHLPNLIYFSGAAKDFEGKWYCCMPEDKPIVCPTKNRKSLCDVVSIQPIMHLFHGCTAHPHSHTYFIINYDKS